MAAELLDQAAGRLALRAQAAFLHHHVAFLVELAEDRVAKSLGFHVGPEFEFVGREGEEINRGIGTGAGVQPDRALARDDLIKLILDDVLVGLLLGLLPDLFEGFDLVGVRLADAEAFLVERLIGAIDLVERGFLGGVIGGADSGGALESHVLEHVGQAGDAGHLLRGAHIDMGMERNHGRLRALVNQECEPVLEFVLSEILLERGEILGDCERYPGGQNESD